MVRMDCLREIRSADWARDQVVGGRFAPAIRWKCYIRNLAGPEAPYLPQTPQFCIDSFFIQIYHSSHLAIFPSLTIFAK